MEHALQRVDSKETRNISIVRESSTEADQSDGITCLFDLTDSPANDTLQNWASIVMQKVDLINDN